MHTFSDDLRRQFPFLLAAQNGRPLAYLDNAATTQKPLSVLEAMDTFYRTQCANVHRGVHPLAEQATIAYEQARRTVQTFIGAAEACEIIFTRHCTESINLVARSYGETIPSEKRIVLSPLEHHSNTVPWLQLRKRQGNAIEWMTLARDGRVDLKSLATILEGGNVALVSVTGLSNVLGVRTPLRDIITMAHAVGAKVLVDAAQLVAHARIDVQELDVDFLAFSGHKIYGPTGVGVLYGKRELLEQMPPFLGGGDMLAQIDRDGFSNAELPRKFEAGTPSIADAIGLDHAIRWMTSVGIDTLHRHGKTVLERARKALLATPSVTILGPKESDDLLGCISFTVKDIHPHDLTDLLGKRGVCLRAGHHCAQILHAHLGIPASARLSVGAYNTEEDITRCIEGIEEARTILLGRSPAH